MVVPGAALCAWCRSSHSEETVTVGPTGGGSGGQQLLDGPWLGTGDSTAASSVPEMTWGVDRSRRQHPSRPKAPGECRLLIFVHSPSRVMGKTLRAARRERCRAGVPLCDARNELSSGSTALEHQWEIAVHATDQQSHLDSLGETTAHACDEESIRQAREQSRRGMAVGNREGCLSRWKTRPATVLVRSPLRSCEVSPDSGETLRSQSVRWCRTQRRSDPIPTQPMQNQRRFQLKHGRSTVTNWARGLDSGYCGEISVTAGCPSGSARRSACPQAAAMAAPTAPRRPGTPSMYRPGHRSSCRNER
jgi:hypothetical protein